MQDKPFFMVLPSDYDAKNEPQDFFVYTPTLDLDPKLKWECAIESVIYSTWWKKGKEPKLPIHVWLSIMHNDCVVDQNMRRVAYSFVPRPEKHRSHMISSKTQGVTWYPVSESSSIPFITVKLYDADFKPVEFISGTTSIKLLLRPSSQDIGKQLYL